MGWFGRTILVLSAIVVLVVPALWIGRDVLPPRMVRWAINHAAGAEVIDDLAFRVASLSSGHVEVIDLRVNRDAGLVAERVRIGFEPADLVAGRLRTVTVTAAVARASVGPSGAIDLDGLGPLIAAFPGDPEAAAEPALRRLEFHDATVRLVGTVTGAIRLDGAVMPSAAGLSGSGTWRIDAETQESAGPLEPGLALAAEGSASVEQADGAWRVAGTVAEGRVARAGLVVSGLAGHADFTLPAVGAPEGGFEMSAQRVEAGTASLEAPFLHVRYDPAGVSGTARLGPEAAPEIEIAAVADAVDGDGRRGFRINARADLQRLDTLLAAWTGRSPVDLQGEATAELAGRAPIGEAEPAAIWAGTVASGGITVRLADSRLPEPITGRVRGEARLALALAAGRLAVETAGPAGFDAVLAEAAPGLAGDWIPAGPLRLEFGSDASAFRAMLEAPFGDARAEIAGPIRMTAGETGSAFVDASAAFHRGQRGWDLARVAHADAEVSGVHGRGVEIERLRARIEGLVVAAEGPSGGFAIDLRANAPGLGIGGAEISAAGRIDPDPRGIVVRLTEPGRLAVERLAPAAPLAPTHGFAARLAASDSPVLTLPSGAGPIELRLPLDLQPLVVASVEPDAWSVSLGSARVTAEAWLEPSGSGGQVRARLNGATALVAPLDLTLEGLAVDARLELTSAGVRLDRIDVAARRIVDQARLARFVPLSLQGAARGVATAAEPDRLVFKATLRGADGAFVLDAAGRHSPGSGRGEAGLTLFPIRFVPGGLQPADLSPTAAALFRHASGEIALAGRVRWPGEAVPPDDPLTLTLDNLGFSGSLGTVAGLAGSIALTQVDPPATAPGQVLTATAIDIGVPVEAPRIRFRLEPERILRLEAVEGRFAGGLVTATDLAVPLDGQQPVPIVLTIEDVDAALLAQAVDLDGLSATGILSGWLPLLWDPATGLSVRQARLVARAGGGSLRYQPEERASALQDSGEEVSLLLKAIRNFVYESFEVEADGRPGEPFDVKIRLRGANPDLYDGYPIALNVTLTGALDQLFGNLRRSLGLTDVIRRRFEASGGG